MKKSEYGVNTNLVRGGIKRSQFKETSEAIFFNSGFVYDTAEQAEAIFAGEETGFQYSRYANPTVEMFENRLALLEGAESCFATASGMAAVFGAMICQLKQGDHLVSSAALFGSCRYIITSILPKYGIEVTLVDGKNLEEWKNGFQKNTKLVFFETPSNPCLEIIDIAAVCELAKNHGAKVIADNIFASPVLQNTMKFGADIVVYSGTKHIDGQGRAMGGAVLSTEEFKEETLKPFLRHTGPCMSPFNAWVLLKGLETLKLRVLAQSESAFQLAKYLTQVPQIEEVFYPFLENSPQLTLAKKQQKAGGTVLSFKIKGTKKEAFCFMNRLKILDISNNLGDTKSLITHPATTTHRVLEEKERLALGITENLIRISVGLEDIEDIISDINQAFS